ncbi:amidase [Frigoribacterium sp. PvP120]|uniref:AtzH-like domain-containing protein n=1 Tax=unclassified Frigoribacterium TaxID=2627005 RepID=UPI001B65E8C6|nr:AtzH-like domain-containing protein [Frigoribacterium sp. PvP121]MBP1242704.1 Asp-tRNA(Asn)/Glu-tRNA(Gln) amidotransferase A subunit family amidase [Frigoribacterium sp. PvP121]
MPDETAPAPQPVTSPPVTSPPVAPLPVTTLEGGELPDGLLDAVAAYEDALRRDDAAALADAFEPGPGSVRVDAQGVLVGHDAITAFRARRGGAPARRVEECHVRVLDPGSAVVVTVTAPAGGGRGVVTQLWRRGAGQPWRIATAHVQAPRPAVDTRVWRVVGGPLVPARASSGPLAGRTVAVKDLFAVAGHAVGAGVPAWLAEQPVETASAPAVELLLAAGASVAGLAQTDEFAYSVAGRNGSWGTPPNGAVPGALPGGSSSGPASAVALGQADVGLGTDTGGSVRVPASYQGLWGLRTTHGTVPREGLLPLAPTFDTVGWLTRDAATLRAAAEASLGSAPAVPAGRGPSDLSGASVVVDPRVLDGVEPDVAAAVGVAVDRLVEAGRLPRPDAVAVGDLGALLELFRVVQAAEAWRSHGRWIEAHPGVLSPDVASRFAAGAGVDAEQEQEARVGLAEARRALDAVLGDAVLLLPSASSAAPRLDASPEEVDRVRGATLRLTSLAGVTGRPAVSAPLLRVAGGPVGLCLVGPRGSDLALVDLAASLVG